MPLYQFLFKSSQNKINDIKIDCFITESATATAEVTKNPVEKGADITDHIIINPMTFQIEGLVSNISSGLKETIESLSSANPLTSKAKTAWEDLLELHASREKFTLVQGLMSYPDVVLVQLDTTRDKDTVNALRFNASLQQLIIAGTSTLEDISYVDSDTEDKATPQTKGGTKQLVSE